jgi:uncharacterized membrane protein YcjF (UPF0283 family)
MTQRAPRYCPLTTIGVIDVLVGVAGFLWGGDLTAIGRSMPMWLVYGLAIVSGVVLLAVVAHVRWKRRPGGAPSARGTREG